MHIPFHRPHITDEEITAVSNAIRSGWITMGEQTHRFESLFSEYIGAPYCVALNSGTAALHLALCCMGISPGDEVIIPAMTFTATAEVVRYFNARPVMADISRETLCLDPGDFKKRITSNTKAVIPVHYGGQPADMDEIRAIARDHHLAVIEDAAHALPSLYKDQKIGTLSDITCFSFYATKTLSTGEGGMAVTGNEHWADLMKQLRLHGISRDAWNRYSSAGKWQYDVQHAGFKYNMSDINASMGIVQLAKIDRLLNMRRSIAEKYNTAFGENDAFIPYRIRQDRDTSWHLYPLMLNLDCLNTGRDRFIEELKEKEISTSVHFIPLYRFTYYGKEYGLPAAFPNTEWAFERTLSLPIFPGMTGDEVDYVIDVVLKTAKSHRR